MKNVNMNPDAKLSFLERFAYGIGDYAGNLVYSAISAFLLVYYTNVIGASAAAAASIIAISKFLDGILDFFIFLITGFQLFPRIIGSRNQVRYPDFLKLHPRPSRTGL